MISSGEGWNCVSPAHSAIRQPLKPELLSSEGGDSRLVVDLTSSDGIIRQVKETADVAENKFPSNDLVQWFWSKKLPSVKCCTI